MSDIHVECYAGHRADEKPLRFAIRGRQFRVDELDGQWYSPEASYSVSAPTMATTMFYVMTRRRIFGPWTAFAPLIPNS